MMLLGLGLARISEIVGALGGRKCSEDFADCGAAALRNKRLSLAKTCSIGFRSGEYFGRKKSLAPAARMSWRTLWLCDYRDCP